MATTVYDDHRIANLQLPAVTVAAAEAKTLSADEAFWLTDLMTNHEIAVSVRVHTGYIGGEYDRVEATLLMDQVVDTLKKNINMDDGYRLMDFEVVTFDQEFEESKTIGAEVIAILHKIKDYAQT